MKVLIACEYSGTVRRAFAKLGHEVASCDLLDTDLPCEANETHYQADIFDVFDSDTWDMVIAHPPCTHLSVSGARHFAAKRADGRQQAAIDFFMKIAELPVKYLAIENPVCIMSTIWRKPDQIIQPYMFGDPYMKTTCLWLKGLVKLAPTDIVEGREQKCWKEPPGPDRWKNRSKTYPGIAQAMAQQWRGI